MSGFLTSLNTQRVSDNLCSGRGVDRITRPFAYESDLLGRIVIVEPGFLTDYASVPRVPLGYLLLGGRAAQPAVIHDWLYHHHEVCDEDTANRVLFEAMVADGTPGWVRALIYLGVKIGGASSWGADGAGNGHSIVDGCIV